MRDQASRVPTGFLALSPYDPAEVKTRGSSHATPLDSGVPKGIRTPVTAVKGQCPRPLDDGDVTNTNGGARRDQTADLLHAMQALSQLSYSP